MGGKKGQAKILPFQSLRQVGYNIVATQSAT